MTHVAQHITIEAALSLSVGVALYLIGEVMFRRCIWRRRSSMLARLAVLVPLIAVDTRDQRRSVRLR